MFCNFLVSRSTNYTHNMSGIFDKYIHLWSGGPHKYSTQRYNQANAGTSYTSYPISKEPPILKVRKDSVTSMTSASDGESLGDGSRKSSIAEETVIKVKSEPNNRVNF